MTTKEVYAFLLSHNLLPGRKITITLDEYTKVVDEGRKLHGKLFAQILMNCFMPEKQSNLPSYNESLSMLSVALIPTHYTFSLSTWLDVGNSFAPVIEPKVG